MSGRTGQDLHMFAAKPVEISGTVETTRVGLTRITQGRADGNAGWKTIPLRPFFQARAKDHPVLSADFRKSKSDKNPHDGASCASPHIDAVMRDRSAETSRGEGRATRKGFEESARTPARTVAISQRPERIPGRAGSTWQAGM